MNTNDDLAGLRLIKAMLCNHQFLRTQAQQFKRIADAMDEVAKTLDNRIEAEIDREIDSLGLPLCMTGREQAAQYIRQEVANVR